MKEALVSKNRMGWISFAIILSLLLHGAFFLFLNTLSLQNKSRLQVALVEQQKNAVDSIAQEKIKKEVAEKRSQELSTIFHALSIEPIVPEVTGPPEFESTPVDLIAEATAEESHLELPIEALPTEPLPFDLETLSDSSDRSPLPQTSFGDLDPFQPPQIDLQSSGEELIQATKPLFGSIVSEIADPEPSEDSLTVGGLETTLIQGNSFKEREGLADHGFTDLEEQTAVVLMPPVETETLRHALLKHTKSIKRGSLFPFHSNILLPEGLGGYLGIQHHEEGCNTLFDCKIEYAPKKEMTGYFFRLTFIPKEENQFQRIPQNYFFIIDRSRSIQSRRYEMTKNAVAKALERLEKGDTFNLFVFDDEVEQFSEFCTPWNAKNVNKARQFLAQQKSARTFSSTDLHSSLAHILRGNLPQDKTHVAILLSDGDTYLSKTNYREIIKHWSTQSPGEIALFTVPVGRGNNLSLLELLSAFNRGALFHAPSDHDIEATLTEVISKIKTPIAKEVVITSIFPDVEPSSPLVERKVTFFPPQQRLPIFYENIPYVVYGSIDTLENFHFFLQGQDRNDILTIKEFIDFKKAERIGSLELDRFWALQQSYDLYAQFLVDGQQRHLNEIKKLLRPYNLVKLFQ